VQGVLASGSSGLSGSKLPLVNIKLQVLPDVAPGVYQDAVSLSSASSLTPVAQLSSIFANRPVHFDFSGTAPNGIAVQIGSNQVHGILVSSEHSPIFDITPSQGAIHEFCKCRLC
jgi:hypothetical protein